MLKIIISLSTISLIILSVFAYYFFYTDTIVYEASRMYPLDKNHSYMIKKNDGNEQIPAGVVYVIVPADKPNTHIDFGTSGSVIGGSDIDIAPFLNQKVIIDGFHYDGVPLILKSSNLPTYYATDKMAVIYINSLSSPRLLK